MQNASAKCFCGAFSPFSFHAKPVLLHQQLVIILVAKIRLLWFLEVLIQLRRCDGNCKSTAVAQRFGNRNDLDYPDLDLGSTESHNS